MLRKKPTRRISPSPASGLTDLPSIMTEPLTTEQVKPYFIVVVVVVVAVAAAVVVVVVVVVVL
jgi:hypothetical protein